VSQCPLDNILTEDQWDEFQSGLYQGFPGIDLQEEWTILKRRQGSLVITLGIFTFIFMI
jgi:hypothetical protein